MCCSDNGWWRARRQWRGMWYYMLPQRGMLVRHSLLAHIIFRARVPRPVINIPSTLLHNALCPRTTNASPTCLAHVSFLSLTVAATPIAFLLLLNLLFTCECMLSCFCCVVWCGMVVVVWWYVCDDDACMPSLLVCHHHFFFTLSLSVLLIRSSLSCTSSCAHASHLSSHATHTGVLLYYSQSRGSMCVSHRWEQCTRCICSLIHTFPHSSLHSLFMWFTF